MHLRGGTFQIPTDFFDAQTTDDGAQMLFQNAPDSLLNLLFALAQEMFCFRLLID